MARGRSAADFVLALALVALLLLAAEGASRLAEPDDHRARALRFEPPPAKPPGTFRIFFFGSSVVYGSPVPELGFVAQIEYWLRRSTPPGSVEVRNLAVPASGTDRIRDAVEVALDWEPDLLFLHTGMGEFFFHWEPGPVGRLARRLQRHSALVRLARRFATRGRRLSDLGDEGPLIRPFDRSSGNYRRRIERYRENVTAIVDAAERAGTPIILATVVSNLADWRPANRSFAERLYEPGAVPPFDAIEARLREGDVAGAVSRIEAALAERPDDALLLFQRARAHEALGEYDRARALYVRARDLDPLPWRILGELNDFLRELGRRDGVVLLDLERLLEERAPHGLPGFETFLDNAHPNPETHAAIARATLELLASRGWALDPDADVPSSPDPFAVFLEHARREAAPRDLESEVLFHAAMSCLKPPHQQLDAGRAHLLAWRDRDPSNWRVFANLASVSFFEGDLERARRELREAMRLKGTAGGVADPDDAPFLRSAMRSAGVRAPP